MGLYNLCLVVSGPCVCLVVRMCDTLVNTLGSHCLFIDVGYIIFKRNYLFYINVPYSRVYAECNKLVNIFGHRVRLLFREIKDIEPFWPRISLLLGRFSYV